MNDIESRGIWVVIGGGLGALALGLLSAEHVDLTARWAEALIGAGGAAVALGAAYLAAVKRR
ncbi:MAG: hypothetical protein L6R00_06405 [Phycisphaerae bacterium]|nr:hypothetical protein [Phycisphaerae bacterium]